MKCCRSNIFSHSLLMLLRNIQAYALLSVTISFSYVVLFVYLVGVDSSINTNYRKLFAVPRNIVMTYSQDRNYSLAEMQKDLSSSIPGTTCYIYHEVTVALSQYGELKANMAFLPNGNRPLFFMKNQKGIDETSLSWNSAEQVRFLNDFHYVGLKRGEAIINESFFLFLNRGEKSEAVPKVSIAVRDGTGQSHVLSLAIIGVCCDTEYETSPYINEKGVLCGDVRIYTSEESLNLMGRGSFLDIRQVLWTCSKTPEKVAARLSRTDLPIHAVCQAQDEAKGVIRDKEVEKVTVTVVLFLVLGINIVSSFSNVLSKRQYEIGIKRAIGAAPRTIIYQFFLECFVVMIVNLILAILITVDIMIAYKIYAWYVLKREWAVSVSPYSCKMATICCISVTVTYSLYFAYKATRIRIHEQLISE